MRKRSFFLLCSALSLTVAGANAQTTAGGGSAAGAGAAGAGAAAGSTPRVTAPPVTSAGTANGTSVNSSSGFNSSAAPNVNNTAGALTRQQVQRTQPLMNPPDQQLEPGLAPGQTRPGFRQIPPGLNSQFIGGSGFVTNSSGMVFAPNGTQLGSLSNLVSGTMGQNLGGPGFVTNGAGVVELSGQSLAGSNTIGQVGIGGQTNQFAASSPGRINPLGGGALVRGDRALTASDQLLLNRIRNSVLPLTGGSRTAVSPVHFDLRNGVVTLTGTVPTADVQQRVLSTVQGTPGVVQVVNNIQVNPNGVGTAVGGATDTGENVIMDRDNGNATGLNRGALPPGLQNRNNLPPGLQGRQALPPGLAQQTNAPATSR